ncbi:ectonucleoside triphosphate diphosphohydrolase 1-like isoform X2 [Crassostrea virginica]
MEMTVHVILSMATLFLMDRACAVQVQYSVMLDAGSSSTKLRVYSWPERSSTSSTLHITEKYFLRIKPPLSSFQENLELLPEYLLNLTSLAQSQVPYYSHNKTHIYLLATAGIRFLKEEKAKSLMDTVRRVLSDKRNHNFKYTERSVRILSGEEEGVFAWITANYHNGFFSSNRSLSKAVGVLEMGGGSTQITFIPDGPLLAHMFSLRIAGKIYNLYSHSYLNFGKDYMDRRIKEYLIQQSPSAKTILNPCSLENDNYNYDNGDTTVIFRGSSSPSECLSIISNFLRHSYDTCYPKPCAIGSIYQPSIGSDIFYATASFAFIAADLNATDATGRLDIVKLNQTAHDYCSKTIEEAYSVYRVPSAYGSSTCMMALYITELLTFSYGFPVNTNRIFSFQKVNGKSLDWPFGAVVYEAELMARDYPCGPIPLETNAAAGQSPTALLELLILLCFSTLCAFV